MTPGHKQLLMQALEDTDLNDKGDYADIYPVYAVDLLRSAVVAMLEDDEQGSPLSIPEEELSKLLPCSYYMDPPDGGSVTILEQLERMARDSARYRWLREHGTEVQQWGGEVWFPYDGKVAARLDNAIDAAIAKETK